MFYTQTGLVTGSPAVNCIKHNPIQSFQDPHIGFQQCFNLHGKLSSYGQCKISMGDYLQRQTSKSLYTVNFWLFCENKKKDNHMQIINTPQDPRSLRSSPTAKIFAKTHSFQDPRNFTSTVHSNNRVQTLSHRLQHRTRTLLQFISHYCTYSSVTFKLLKSTVHPLRTHSWLHKST